NVLEPASVRDSGDEAKLGATISSHLSRRRSRVRVPSLPPHGVPRPPRLGVGRARRQADRRGALLASAGPSPFEYPHGASDCVIVAPLPRQVRVLCPPMLAGGRGGKMNRAGRVIAVSAGIAFAAALVTYYIVSYLMMTPPSVAATGRAP